MNPSYTIEDVDIKTLYRMMLEHLRAGFRLVQIGATGREDGTELIYSVAKDYQMDNFRVFVESGEIINSISDIFPLRRCLRMRSPSCSGWILTVSTWTSMANFTE